MNKTLTSAWDFFKENFKWILIAALFLFLWGKGCFKRFEPQEPTIIRDTIHVYHEYQSPVYTPPVVNVLPGKPDVINLPQYQPDTSSIQALRAQFNDLVTQHTDQVTYNDTLRIDSIGYVSIKDTVSENKLQNRSYSYKIGERIITNTITLPPPKAKNQVYIGFNAQSIMNSVNSPTVGAGVMFKNKKDGVLQLSGLYDFKYNQPIVQMGVYSKIRL